MYESLSLSLLCIYIYIYIYVYTHTYTHICTHITCVYHSYKKRAPNRGALKHHRYDNNVLAADFPRLRSRYRPPHLSHFRARREKNAIKWLFGTCVGGDFKGGGFEKWFVASCVCVTTVILAMLI